MLSQSIEDREFQKFEDDGVDPDNSKRTKVRVTEVDGFFFIPKEAISFAVSLANSDLDLVFKFYSVPFDEIDPIFLLKTITLHHNAAQTLELIGGDIA